MTGLRVTRSLHKYFELSDPDLAISDNALGSWHMSRFYIGRQPILLLVSEHSLLAILTFARDIRSVAARLDSLVRNRLERVAGKAVVEREIQAMQPVVVAKAQNRSVLGHMNDFVRVLRGYEYGASNSMGQLATVEDILAEMPCGTSRSIHDCTYPGRKARELLNLHYEV